MLVLNSNSSYTGDNKDLPGYWPTFGIDPLIAISLRRVSPGYSGPAIRVRRSSDSAETDIGFDANGNLDTATMLSFSGSASLYVSVWYDQSGNGLHATRSTLDGQGRIVNNGVIEMMGSRPGIYLDGINDGFSLDAAGFELIGSKTVASAITFRMNQNVASTPISIFSFYDSGKSKTYRRYNLAMNFRPSENMRPQILSTQSDTDNASNILTINDSITTQHNSSICSYIDGTNGVQGIRLNDGEFNTGSASKSPIANVFHAVLGGGSWSSGALQEPAPLRVSEFILATDLNSFFLSNINANQMKYFTD
ncbi:hypothetical protein DQB71_17085 [Klebsiella pneumoniae subsp. pneumoniae]|uniref:arabinofuranosidase catalytic domain-containing protein n=1 Tax=Klebsiella pneumoniae TaxID=573 RepID=UPI000DC7579D|nr:arabinofuranosidase catalytic domain-containing protein [Klebsiella pneumoniae]AWX82086.1 hypothetical protein DQB71_12015 [Klebsiella pneumoniae subsp. pneumoniae]AWX82998.1 hypothetical protein DQB71_17085 [Klebsiella pneumoniae subsp. pneumoniae]